MNVYIDEQDKAIAQSKVTIAPLEEEKLVQEVCRIMLFRERLKPGVPVAHADLIKNVPKKQAASMVVKLAQSKLMNGLGLEMQELRLPGSDAKYYVLRSWMPAALRLRWLQQPRGSLVEQQGFEAVVLALTLMSGEKISERELWLLLEDLGVRKDQQHGTLGAVPQELLKGMVTSRYLKATKTKGPEPEVQYEWGVNAQSELTMEKVKKYISEITAGARRPAAAPPAVT